MENTEATLCPLCRQEKVKIYAVGECAHPICHLCSTKMRILCEQTYCAICRQELSQVYFVSDLADTQPTIDQSRFTPIDGTGDCGIYYPIKADWIRRETEKLLRNFCPFCYSEYETFELLRDHVRRNHRYFYCDLCAENLNLFPHERKCYTRHDLVQHIRYGDRDDTSFKGHPICRFCDDHFLDVDELYKHMRKEHYFCHLCTDDSVYYSDFDLLREHHRSTHYLCEIGQCKDVQFTNAFSNEIDFRAHQAAQHGRTRAEKNQLGTIPMEFQSTTRDRGQRPDPARRGTFSSGEFNTQGGNNSSKNDRDDTHREPAVAAAVPSIDEFPTLGERSSTPVNVSQQRGAWSSDGSRGIHSSADFPALASAASNASNTNASQARGIWREQQQQQQQQQPTVPSSTAASKKAPQPVKPVTNGVGSMNTKEDFPALKGATNAKIPAPVSMFSTWSTVKKSAKHGNASANTNQPQMRMNTSRLVRDDEEEECIRRPMSSLTTSSNPIASSNISIISSSDLNDAQINNKQNKYKNKNQSVPNSQDFPALPSTTTTQNNASSSGVWSSGGTNPVAKSTTAQQKKKNNALSKKKFMEEVQALPPPPALSSTNDFPAMGLSQLGQRLITEENEPTVTTKIKEEKSASATPKKQEKVEKPLSAPSASSKKQEKAEKPLSPPSSASKNQEKEEKPASPLPPSSKKQEKAENKPTVQPNKKTEKTVKTNDPVKQETTSIKDETPAKLVTSQPVTQPSVKIESAAPPPPPISSTQPPPGFSTPTVVSPPPGFNPIPSSQPAPPSYIFSSSYSKRKDEFRAKLFHLFDGDMTLFVEYDKFCEAFYQTKISSKDFIKYTTDLFKDKLDEYLLELIVIIPNIEQQNELYEIWKKDIHTTPSSSQTANNWTTKNVDEKQLHVCHLCRQIMFESETDEHNSYHPEFNTQFPSLPAAALPLGRGSGRKKK